VSTASGRAPGSRPTASAWATSPGSRRQYTVAKAEADIARLAELRALIREGGPELKPAFDWMNSQQRVFGESMSLTPEQVNMVGHGLQTGLIYPNPLPYSTPPPMAPGWGPDRFDFMKNYPK
jgi:hypothetical protein